MKLLASEGRERDRTEMLEEEFSLLESREWTGRAYQPDDCIRIKGASKLDADQLRVLRAICSLRDKFAHERNRPSFKVWSNDSCLKVAACAPTDKAAMQKALGENHHLVRRYCREVLAAVRTGTSDKSPPPAPTKTRAKKEQSNLPPFTRDNEPLLAHLRQWRNKRAEDEKLGPGMIVNNTVLKGVAALQPKEASELSRIVEIRRWQVKAFGDELVEEVSTWKAARKAKAEQAGEPGSGKRRRRRRGRGKGRGEGQTDSSGASTASSTPDKPSEAAE